MRYILVDFENVNGNGLSGIDKLTKNDSVIIFCGVQNEKISLDCTNSINKSSAHIEFYKSRVAGKNALDFQMVYYIGNLVGRINQSNMDINIISVDHGYDAIRNIAQTLNKGSSAKISRYATISELIGSSKTTQKKSNSKAKKAHLTVTSVNMSNAAKQIYTAISETDYRDEANQVADIVTKQKTRIDIHNALQKRYKNNGDYLQIYSLIKQYIAR